MFIFICFLFRLASSRLCRTLDASLVPRYWIWSKWKTHIKSAFQCKNCTLTLMLEQCNQTRVQDNLNIALFITQCVSLRNILKVVLALEESMRNPKKNCPNIFVFWNAFLILKKSEKNQIKIVKS
jgi:hypothetical protein